MLFMLLIEAKYHIVELREILFSPVSAASVLKTSESKEHEKLDFVASLGLALLKLKLIIAGTSFSLSLIIGLAVSSATTPIFLFKEILNCGSYFPEVGSASLGLAQ